MLFQIEEPDGTPLDAAEGPGVAVGIDLAGREGAVALAVGGNAQILETRDGAPGPETGGLRDAEGALLQAPLAVILLALRGRAERALARPVTHAAVAIEDAEAAAVAAAVATAGAAAELTITRIMTPAQARALAADAPPGLAVAHGAAVAAEDDSLAASARVAPPQT